MLERQLRKTATVTSREQLVLEQACPLLGSVYPLESRGTRQRPARHEEQNLRGGGDEGNGEERPRDDIGESTEDQAFSGKGTTHTQT